MANYRVIGKPVERVDGPEMLTGQAMKIRKFDCTFYIVFSLYMHHGIKRCQCYCHIRWKYRHTFLRPSKDGMIVM